jgi:hypothetical protein
MNELQAVLPLPQKLRNFFLHCGFMEMDAE